MSDAGYGVLFLCTGNSARSMLAECALRRWGGARFRSYSAGSRPTGAPNPLTLEVLREHGHDVSGLRSKSWDEFAAPDAPRIDLVVTVCDSARAETCPVWPGGPLSTHWGSEDPAAAEGSREERLRVFRRVYGEIESRIRRFVELPLEELDRESLQAKLDEIGRSSPEPGRS